jgi:hypothetical protein
MAKLSGTVYFEGKPMGNSARKVQILSMVLKNTSPLRNYWLLGFIAAKR